MFALIGPKCYDVSWRELEQRVWIAAARLHRRCASPCPRSWASRRQSIHHWIKTAPVLTAGNHVRIARTFPGGAESRARPEGGLDFFC